MRGKLAITAARRTNEPLYLDVDRVQPGDVLLTCGPKLESKLIAWLTLGEFSHARLMLGHIGVLESDDIGVGPRLLSVSRVECSPTRHLHELEADKAVLLRHPALANAGIEMLASTKAKLYEKAALVTGKQYPATATLASAARGGPLIRRSLEPILRWCDTKPLPVNAGVICSRLVLDAYAHLGLALFEHPPRAESVSPNTLVDSELMVVTGAIGFANRSAKVNDIQVQFPLADRMLSQATELAAGIVQFSALAEDLKHVTDTALQLVDRVRTDQLKATLKSTIVRLQQANAPLDQNRLDTWRAHASATGGLEGHVLWAAALVLAAKHGVFEAGSVRAALTKLLTAAESSLSGVPPSSESASYLQDFIRIQRLAQRELEAKPSREGTEQHV